MPSNKYVSVQQITPLQLLYSASLHSVSRRSEVNSLHAVAFGVTMTTLLHDVERSAYCVTLTVYEYFR
jgi:hypothetical protein